MSDRPEAAEPVMWTYVVSATITSFIGLYMYAFNDSSLPDGRAEAFIGQSAPQFATILLPAAIMLTWRSLHRPALWAMGGALVVEPRDRPVGDAQRLVRDRGGDPLGILPRLETGRRLALIVAAAVVALAMLLAPGVGDLLTERLNTAIESGGTGRTAIWAVGLNVVPEHPIIGIGYGDFPSVINPENVRATILPVQTDVLDFPIGPHNIVVGVLVELGVVGLILLFGVARSLFRGRARTEASVLARAVMIGFAVQSLFLGIANLKQVWLFLAIALGLAAAERLSQARRTRPASGRGRRRRHRRGRRPAPGAGAAAASAPARGRRGGRPPRRRSPSDRRRRSRGPKATTAKAGTGPKAKPPPRSRRHPPRRARRRPRPPPDEPDPTLGPRRPTRSRRSPTTPRWPRGAGSP